MRKRICVLAASLLVWCFSFLGSSVVSACGESLFPVGKGVIFRSYATPLPGRILVVTHSPGGMQMVERLRAAGHDVRVVSESDQIGSALDEADVDIVMSMFEQRQTVAQQIAGSGSGATYLPVAQQDSPEIAAVKTYSRRYLSSDDSVKTFLKVIHRTLKDKQV